jgi:hypothetical protein
MDDDESGGRGSTCHHHGNCNNVVGYCRHHLSQDCDQDYVDKDNNTGRTTRHAAK